MTMTENWKKITTAIAAIDKAFGKGAIMCLGDTQRAVEDVKGIPTGSLGLDLALGTGGIPRGRIIEIFGPESSGKTTLMLSAIASLQAEGGIAAYVDAEHALDPAWAAKLGVDLTKLPLSQPDSGEQALSIVEVLAKSGSVDLIVVDSVAALTPKAELEGDMGDAHMGLQARMMSQALRKLTGTAHKHNCCIAFINQLRQKIGVVYGNPETTTGGNALKFFASVRLDIRRAAAVKHGDEVKGNRVKVKVVKNKLASPFRTAEFDVLFDSGIDRHGEVLDLGVEAGTIDKAGAWFSFDGERLGQGREASLRRLREQPALMNLIRERLLTRAPAMAIDAAAE